LAVVLGGVVCLLLAVSAPAMAASAVVGTQYGELQGQVTAGHRAFLGIPFAAPPIGDRRWKPPQAPASWSGVRDATSFGPRCPQNVDAINPSGSTNEDCLYLNVYTPSGGSNLPVIVWFHGGAWLIGAGSDYDPTELVERQNVIVVTINYRLGPFGWLALPGLKDESAYHSTGNYGLMDQQQALRWVKANIGGFGGDPGNVTIAGESAGSFSVCDHLAAPGSAGLFQRAIAESGPCAGTAAALAGVDMETRSTRFAARAALGCRGSAAAVVACMRGKSTEQLVNATGQGNDDASLVSKATFFPSVDGHYLPMTPRQAIATGHANRVPLLIGSNHDEGTLFSVLEVENAGRELNADTYKSELATVLDEFLPIGSGIAADLLVGLYPLRNYPTPAGYDPYQAPAHLAYGAILTDVVFACAATLGDELTSAAGLPTYAYEFNDPSPPSLIPSPNAPLRSAHTAEIQYVFGRGIFGAGGAAYVNMTPAQVTLSHRMQGYWANFARTGNPNGSGLPSWPSYRPLFSQIMNLAPSENTIGPISATGFNLDHKCGLWGPVTIVQPAFLTILDLLPTSQAGRDASGSGSAAPGTATGAPATAQPTAHGAPPTGNGASTPAPSVSAGPSKTAKAKAKARKRITVHIALRDRARRSAGRLTATVSIAGRGRRVRLAPSGLSLPPGTWWLKLCAGPKNGALGCSLSARVRTHTRRVHVPAMVVSVAGTSGALRLTVAAIDGHDRVRAQGRAASV